MTENLLFGVFYQIFPVFFLGEKAEYFDVWSGGPRKERHLKALLQLWGIILLSLFI